MTSNSATDNRKWWAITALSLMMFLINVDATAVNLALAPIAKEFDANLSTIQWIMNGYLLATAGLMIVGGRLGDIIGRRKVFFIGTTIFTLASLIAGLAPSIGLLITGRIIQGLGMSLIFPQAIAIVSLSFPPQQKALAMSIMASVGGFSQAIGPTFGGFLLHVLGWRSIFFINIPIGIFILFLAAWSIHKSHDQTQKEKIDYLGASLITVALIFSTYALNEMQHWGILSTPFLSFIITAIILLLTFIFIEKKQQHPLVPLSLFFRSNYVCGLGLRFAITYGFGMLFFVMSLYFQNILNFSALHTGTLFLALTLMFGFFSPFAGKLIDHIGVRKPAIVSMILLSVAFYLLTKTSLSSTNSEFILPFILIGIGWALSVPCANAVALLATPHQQTSVATAILYTFAFFGWITGVAITGYILVTLGQHNFMTLLNQLNIHLSETQLLLANKVYSGALAADSATNQFGNGPLAIQVMALARQSFIHGFAITMWVTLLLHLVGLVFSWFIKNQKA